jgi:type IX secretion system PorP/SprF family membrane protein
MKTRTLIILCYAVISVVTIQAQQMPFSSQYYTNMMTINPAMTGSTEYAQAFLSHRSQFAGLQGGPQTSYFSVDGATTNGKIGLGLTALNDVTDILARTNVMINYAYGIQLGTDHILRFGLAMGIQNNRIDFQAAQVVDPNDALLFSSRQNQTVFNADFGLAYTLKRLQIGVAIPQMLTKQPTFFTNTGSNLMYSTSRHLRATLKYEFTVSNQRGIVVYPMLLVRAVKGAPIQWDLNAILDYKKWGWLGVTYHSNSAISISAGVRYKSFTAGYAHDIVVGSVTNFSKRSSEFMLSYTFGEKFKQQQQWNLEMQQRVENLENTATSHQREIAMLQAQQDSLTQQSLAMQQEIDSMKRNVATFEKHIVESDKDVDELQNTIEKPIVQSQLAPMNKDGFRSGKAVDYFTEENTAAPAGYYVIVGAFAIRENAYNFKQSCIERGQVETALIYNKHNSLREVYLLYTTDKAAAIKVKNQFAAQYDKIWILKLD